MKRPPWLAVMVSELQNLPKLIFLSHDCYYLLVSIKIPIWSCLYVWQLLRCLSSLTTLWNREVLHSFHSWGNKQLWFVFKIHLVFTQIQHHISLTSGMSLLQRDARALGQVNRSSEMYKFLTKHPLNMRCIQIVGEWSILPCWKRTEPALSFLSNDLGEWARTWEPHT